MTKRRSLVVLAVLLAYAATLIVFRNTDNWRVGRYLYLYGWWITALMALCALVLVATRRYRHAAAGLFLGLVAVLALSYLIQNQPHEFNACTRPRMHPHSCY